METLAHLCVKILKNPCDGSQSQKLGSFYIYCYFLQRLLKMANEINSKQCKCENECKLNENKCKFQANGRHVISCNRKLCNGCCFFRKFGFACYEMIFTNNPITFERSLKQLMLMVNDKNIIIENDFIVMSDLCYHSDNYQDKTRCVVFQPTTYMFYEIPKLRKLTDNEKLKLNEITLNAVPKNIDQKSDEGKKMIQYIYQILENAFYYKIYYMQKELKLWLNIHHLIHLNNLITTGKNTLLRQEQKVKWNPKTKMQKFAMDVRCIRYHLKMLIFVFNNRFISNNDFISNFLHISPFSDANKKTLDILLLGVAENKN